MPPTSLHDIGFSENSLTIDTSELEAFVVIQQPENTAAGINIEFSNGEQE